MKMFVYRGEVPEEGVLTELTDVSPHCFRSRTSMLLAKDDKVRKQQVMGFSLIKSWICMLKKDNF